MVDRYQVESGLSLLNKNVARISVQVQDPQVQHSNLVNLFKGEQARGEVLDRALALHKLLQ